MLKLLLTAAIPFQGLIDKVSPTHRFINLQALAVLTADGKRQQALWLHQYLDDFNEGCDWADTGWKNVRHMYDPDTGFGFKGWPSAVDSVREYWGLAVRYHHEHDLRKAFFHLGAAAHLVQDLCVPHHAAVRLFDGHKQFEQYAVRYRHRFAVHGDGIYNLARMPEGWAINNAIYTRARYGHCLDAACSRQAIQAAVSDLLPRAQRTTAGFVAYFCRETGVS